MLKAPWQQFIIYIYIYIKSKRFTNTSQKVVQQYSIKTTLRQRFPQKKRETKSQTLFRRRRLLTHAMPDAASLPTPRLQRNPLMSQVFVADFSTSQVTEAPGPRGHGRGSSLPWWCSGGVYFPSLIILSRCSRMVFSRAAWQSAHDRAGKHLGDAGAGPGTC